MDGEEVVVVFEIVASVERIRKSRTRVMAYSLAEPCEQSFRHK